MPNAVLPLVVVWGGICLVWAGLLISQSLAKRRGLFLEPQAVPNPTNPPERCRLTSVCVVVPARNEAAGLRACVDSILSQDYPELSLVIVDDRSEDETAAVAAEIADSQPRVRTERVETLPAGWMAKSHALWYATRKIESDWLLFVDADCLLNPQAVTTVMAEAHRRQVDLLTLWPGHDGRGFWERTTIPLCAGIIALWFGSPGANAAGSRSAFANGQFLLISRKAYERIGGHRAVRDALIEDIPLAQRARHCKVRCWVAGGRKLVSVRMYAGYGAIRDGWARIFVGALRSGTKMFLSVVWLLLGSLMPFVAATFLIARALSSHASSGPMEMSFRILSGLCVLHLSLIGVVSYRFWGMGGCQRRYLFLYPLSVLTVIHILARSWWWLVVRRRVSWRGTPYAINGNAQIIAKA